MTTQANAAPTMTETEAWEALGPEGKHYLLTGEIIGEFPNNGRHQCGRLGLVDGLHGLRESGLRVAARGLEIVAATA